MSDNSILWPAMLDKTFETNWRTQVKPDRARKGASVFGLTLTGLGFFENLRACGGGGADRLAVKKYAVSHKNLSLLHEIL